MSENPRKKLPRKVKRILAHLSADYRAGRELDRFLCGLMVRALRQSRGRRYLRCQRYRKRRRQS